MNAVAPFLPKSLEAAPRRAPRKPVHERSGTISARKLGSRPSTRAEEVIHAGDITLYINSPGGSVSAGMAIYDTMQFIPCDVSTVCFGMAASMGAFLLGAGSKGKRKSLPNARRGAGTWLAARQKDSAETLSTKKSTELSCPGSSSPARATLGLLGCPRRAPRMARHSRHP